MIYWFLPDFDRFDCFVLDSEGERAVNRVVGKVLGEGWVPPAAVEIEQVSGKLGDFPGVTGCCSAVFSARAWNLLSKELSLNAETLPFPSPVGEFVIVNVLQIEDCLDPERTEFMRFTDGSVSRIADPVFRDDFQPSHAMFRVTDFPPQVFVTEEFKAAVTRNKLRGLHWPKKK